MTLAFIDGNHVVATRFMHLDGLTTLLTKCTEEMATFGLGDAIIDKLRSHLKTIDQVKSITSIMQRDDHERTLKRAVHGDLLDVVK